MGQPLKLIVLVGAFFVGLKKFFTGKGTDPSSRVGQSDREDSSRWKHSRSRTAKYFAAFAGMLAIGGFLLVVSGIIPTKASSGHWAITRWFLELSLQRSASTHTIGLDTPQLGDPGLVLKGAGTYETNCRACHGSPVLPNPRVAQHMLPRPPFLPTVLHEWDDAELFYIVKHGIKFTGMPAWPAPQRDDEVWAMVAFIRLLPGLNETEYRRLVGGDVNLSREVVPLEGLLGPTDVPPAITTSCARCHGADGLGRGEGVFPKLAGQSSVYLYHSLQAYAREERHSGVMGPIAAGLDDEDLRKLAHYYARLEALPPFVPPGSDAEGIARGRRIALEGIPEQRIPSCASCHGPNTFRRNPAYPDLAGQYSDYLSLQLHLFKQDARGGSNYAYIMREIAVRLAAQQVRDVSLYYSSLSPARRDR